MSEDVERLQAAARQLIAAGRAFLDIVEEVVEDPERVATTATTVVKVVKGAVSGLGTIDLDDPWVGAAGAEGYAADDEPSSGADGDAGNSADDEEVVVLGDDADLIAGWSAERSTPSRVRRVSLD